MNAFLKIRTRFVRRIQAYLIPAPVLCFSIGASQLVNAAVEDGQDKKTCGSPGNNMELIVRVLFLGCSFIIGILTNNWKDFDNRAPEDRGGRHSDDGRLTELTPTSTQVDGPVQTEKASVCQIFLYRLSTIVTLAMWLLCSSPEYLVCFVTGGTGAVTDPTYNLIAGISSAAIILWGIVGICASKWASKWASWSFCLD